MSLPPLIEKYCISFYYLDYSSVSLWQAVFLASCGLALWDAVRRLRGSRARSLLGIGVLVVIGAGLRLGLSPKNMLDANYRGLGRHHMIQGFQKEHSAAGIRDSGHYYMGYGQSEYWKLFLWDRKKAGIDDAFRIDGFTSILDIVLFFIAAWLIFGESEAAFWSAAMLAFAPVSIRLSFGDSVYAFGATLVLLSLTEFMLFFETGRSPALFAALGFAYCAIYTHVAFLPLPLMAPFFYPLRGRRWRDLGTLLSRPNICLFALFLALALPAYYAGAVVFSDIAERSGTARCWEYLGNVLGFLLHRTNAFFNPDFNPHAVMALFLLGLGSLLARSRGVLAAAAAAIFLLALPLPPTAVCFGPGGNDFVNTGMVKQPQVFYFFLLVAAHGLRWGLDRLERWVPRRRLAAAALGLLALQPLAYRDFIVKEYNYQKEISFLRRNLSRRDAGEHIFTLAPGLPRIDSLYPGRYEVHSIGQSLSTGDAPASPADHRPTLDLLDWMLAEDAAPVFYLSMNCYHRHLLDPAVLKGPGIRDECARFLKRYALTPIVEESFGSDPYNVEFDRTDAETVTLGLYRIGLMPGVKKGAAPAACAGAVEQCVDFSLKRAADLLSASRWEDALGVLERAEAIKQGHPGLWLMLDKAAGSPRRVLEVFDRLVKKHPGIPGLRIDRAEQLMKFGRRREALEALHRSVGLDSPAEDLRRAARAYQQAGECGRALRIWARLESGPRVRAKDLSDKAVCDHIMGDWRGAVSDLERALSVDPANLEAYISLAAVYSGRKLCDQALQVYARGLAIEPAAATQQLRSQLAEGRALVMRDCRPD